MKTLNKYDYLLPLVAMVLLFLTQRDVFPTLIYTILILFMGIYLFPLRDLLFGDNLQKKEKNIDFLRLFANFVLSVLLLISIPLLYLNDNNSIQLIIKILALINFGFLVYYYFKDKDNKRSIIHLCFIFFTAGLLA